MEKKKNKDLIVFNVFAIFGIIMASLMFLNGFKIIDLGKIRILSLIVTCFITLCFIPSIILDIVYIIKKTNTLTETLAIINIVLMIMCYLALRNSLSGLSSLG